VCREVGGPIQIPGTGDPTTRNSGVGALDLELEDLEAGRVVGECLRRCTREYGEHGARRAEWRQG